LEEVETHSKLVRRLKKDPDSIISDLTTGDMDAIHMCLGIAGETGEVNEILAQKAMNLPNFTKELTIELGDLEFYLEGLRQTIIINRADVDPNEVTRLGLMYKATWLSVLTGRLIDKVKKKTVFNKELTLLQVKVALHDVDVCLAGIYDKCDITREEALAGNVHKLTGRYPDGYSDEAATARFK